MFDRPLSLLKLAAQAETFRWKRTAVSTARMGAWYAVAGVMALAALAMLHVAAFQLLREEFRPATAAGIVALADLVLAGILALVARSAGRDRSVREAEAVRDMAINRALGGPLLASVTAGVVRGLVRR
jgi:hypothetical protein